FGILKTSSRCVMPGRRFSSASRRAFVALSSSKIWCRCSVSSAMRVSTESKFALYCAGISRCVSKRRSLVSGGNPTPACGSSGTGTSGCASICARTAASVPEGSRGSRGDSAFERTMGGVPRLAAATGIQQAAHSFHGRCSALQHVCQRRALAEDRVRIGKLNPAVCQAGAVENIQRLKDTHQVGNTLQTILIENMARVLLELVILTARNAAEEPARIFIANAPALHDVEKGAQCRRGKPPPLF